MGVIYTRDRDGNLKQVKTVRVIGAEPAEEIEYKAIAQEQSVTVSGDGESYGEIVAFEPLEVGKTYLVIFEGKGYQCTAYHPTDDYGETLTTITAIGTFYHAARQSYPGLRGPTSDEPFAVTTDVGVPCMCLFTEENGTYSISISKIVKTSGTGSGSGLDTTVKEFNQMNEHLAAYLAAADAAYTDDNGDSVSVMTNYQPTEENHVYDRPLGYPLTATSGNLFLQNENSGDGWKLSVSDGDIRNAIYNAIPGEVSQYLIKDADGKLLENKRIKPTGKVRMLRFYGYVKNCRDLGGWDCDGGTVKYGKLFRSAVVESVETWIDPKIAKNIGIRHQVDFRSDAEAHYITESTLGSEVRYHRFPLELYYDKCVDTTSTDYPTLKKVFRTIIEAAIHDEGLVYNCSLGRDRTGTVTFMLLALLGVAKADIDKDYELSSFSGLKPLQYAYRTDSNYRALVSYMPTFGGETLRDNAVWWFIKAGFSLAELNAFRSAMTNGTPEVLTADDFVQTYAIKKYLTGYEISNADTSVEDGAGYTATLTFADGYNTESSVSVTMGGVDVTADVYADGVITIPAVTGDVVITAVAAYVPTYINRIPISTDYDDNVIFNDVGYMKGYRISSSGDLVANESVHVTGFIPCESGDIVRFKNFWVGVNSTGNMELRIGFYDAGKNVIWTPYWSEIVAMETTVIGADDGIESIVVPTYDTPVAFARFANFYTSSSSIITVNQEIK